MECCTTRFEAGHSGSRPDAFRNTRKIRSSIRISQLVICRTMASQESHTVFLYTCRDSPPGRAVEIVLRHLKVPYKIVDVVFEKGEHFSPKFLEMYPQGEIPIIKDGDLIIGESVAIIQYLAEKYPKDSTFYPPIPEARAVVNHRLAFHLSTLQRRLYDAFILPADYAYETTEDNLKKLKHALKVLNEFFKRQQKGNAGYVAGGNITVADPPMIMVCACLTALGFDLSEYIEVFKWYKNFSTAHPELWKVVEEFFAGLDHYMKNPRDMSDLKHPLHPVKPK